ncbi:hypothetical protein Rsub_13363 [Raphidocelis subcapitata]|uniref:Uncharacterized protein n=1 Tax=Raphidocelis subcapitata TaxID=307507 RepID=A0A2V0PQP8_9CHLO|nr:hypothetical protein Rsub_13363 [Raphidocelis subcapitata]|eukprot:GBG00524.1 hypothetical protein Rsub_13363 [Raphidocelis subcapitata]
MVGANCVGCPSECDGCNPTNGVCDACAPGYWTDGASCVATCPPGTYKSPSTWESGASCAGCVAPCVTCSSATACSTCDSGLYLDRKAKTCVDTCAPGTYASPDNQCRVCNIRCTACTDKVWTACTGCAAPYYLSGTTCGPACPAGTYPDDATRTCKCPTGCKTCSNANTCISCESGYWKTADSKCVTACPAGKYGDTTTRTCTACPTGCKTCTDGDTCTSCESTHWKTAESKCVATCPLGRYGDTAAPRTCVACTTGFWATATGCVNTCPPGSFKSPSTWAANARCAPCIAPCQNCINTIYCLSCKSGGTPSKGVCPVSRRSLLAWATKP